MKSKICATLAPVIVAGLMSATVDAAPLYTFANADEALPASAGNGLNGEIWTGVDVDLLSDAQAYALSNSADATFRSTVVDYPNGLTGSISTSANFDTALGVDAGSISDPIVGATQVLDSILRLTGYLRVDAPGSLFLGLASDDGSELIIQGTQVIANDGIHAFPGANDGPVEISFLESGLYELEILFFESEVSGWGLEFYQGSPSSGTPVAASQLYGAPSPVPLPAGLALVLTGVAGLAGLRWRSKAVSRGKAVRSA